MVVSDYQMPDMDGIEFFNKIKDIQIKKILLTGALEQAKAFTPLNNEIIDSYIHKSSENLKTDLLQHIHKAQLAYFNNITKNIIAFTNDKFSILENQNLIQLIQTLITDNNITEYYMLCETGTFLLQNIEKKFVLNACTNNYLDLFCEMYSQSNKELIDSVKQRKFVPNFELNDHLNLENYFYPCKQTGDIYYNFSELTNQISGI